MKTINIEDALKLKNCIFIDVRTESEYKEDHILDSFSMRYWRPVRHEPSFYMRSCRHRCRRSADCPHQCRRRKQAGREWACDCG